MSYGRRTMHFLVIALVAVAFLFVLMIAVSEASDDSDAYNITFDPNGGSVKNSGSHTGNYVMTASNNVDVTIPWKVISAEGSTYEYYREGYTFLGWKVGNTSTVKAYGETYRGNSNITMYAQWSQTAVSQIIFDANGGTINGSTGGERYAASTSSAVNIPWKEFAVGNSSYNYANTNSTFLGWSTNKSASQADYVSGDVIGSVTSNTGYILYAVWASGSNIIFDPNGGIVNPSNYTVPCGVNQAYTIYVPGSKVVDGNSLNTYTYSREGYKFGGWSVSKSADEAEYPEGYILPPSETGYVLYAVWIPNMFTVTFVYSEGNEAKVDIDFEYIFDSTSYANYHPDGMGDFKIVGWTTVPMVQGATGDSYLLDPDADNYGIKIKLKTPGNIKVYPLWAYVMDSTSFTLEDKYGCYYVAGTGTVTSGGIVIDGGSPYLFIDNLNMDFTSTNGTNRSPIILKTNNNSPTTLTLTLMSDCTLKGRANYNQTSGNRTYSIGYAGINVQSGPCG